MPRPILISCLILFSLGCLLTCFISMVLAAIIR